MNSLRKQIHRLIHRAHTEAEIRAELDFHLEEEAEDQQALGLSEDDAHHAARRSLGNLLRVEEETRAIWIWDFVEQLAQDVRYGARNLAGNPLFTLLAVLTLALGIGANTASYSFMDALLFRSLPVPNPASLVVPNWHTVQRPTENTVVHRESGDSEDDPKLGFTMGVFPYPAFDLLRRQSGVLTTLFAHAPAIKLNLIAHDQPSVENGEYVSGDYFAGLEPGAMAGRLIVGSDDRSGAAPVVVLSYALAIERFGNAFAALGQTIRVNNVPFAVIGVTRPEFSGVDPGAVARFFLPMHSNLLLEPQGTLSTTHTGLYTDNNFYWVQMMGRRRPGVSLAEAQTALTQAFGSWVAATAANDAERQMLPALSLQNGSRGLDHLRRRYAQSVFILLAMVGLILAIACSNIANLLLARAAARSREMAVRLGIGAGRGRVIRQLLTESLMLASLGGAAGILLAISGMRILTAVLADRSSRYTLTAELNWRVLVACATLTLLTGVLFGLAPALRATRADVMSALREGRIGESGRRAFAGFSAGNILLVSQIAISLLLLVTAGLFARTLSNMESIDVGFQRENVLTFTLNAEQAGHRDPEILSFYSGLRQRFAEIPGVRAVSEANSPLIGDGAWGWPIVPLGTPRPEQMPAGHGSWAFDSGIRVLGVGPGFFSTMQIPLLTGREFDERDHAGSLPVAIVNQEWVKEYLEDRNPIGRSITSYGLHMPPQQMEIIGVAKDARYDNLTGSRFPAIVYLPFLQGRDVPAGEMTYFLRTTGNPLRFADSVREIVRRVDARIPVTRLDTEATQIDEEMAEQIVFARLCTGLAVLALLITCVGLYATMSYAVARHTSEIGVRAALGATRGTIVWQVLREVLVVAAAGIAISAPVAFGVTKLIESLLFGVRPNDPASVSFAITMVLIAALLAAFGPARRASRIDPITALRGD